MCKKSPTVRRVSCGAKGFYGFLGGKNEELCSVGEYLTFLVKYVKGENELIFFPLFGVQKLFSEGLCNHAPKRQVLYQAAL